MAKINTKVKTTVFTHEGAKSVKLSSVKELERTVMSCLLWEDGFYEDGVSVADRIKTLVASSSTKEVINLSKKARNEMYLRHIPLLLLREVARSKSNSLSEGASLSQAIYDVIQRPDELTEFLAIYWKDGKCPISKQVKLGLANAFTKFDEYQLAKYNRDGAIKLRDVLFLTHAKPKDENQEQLWKKLVAGTLETPLTWETELSAGKDKAQVFTNLLNQNKIGGLATLRNLRNMESSGVDKSLVSKTLLKQSGKSKILPFRYIAAARSVPQWEDIIEAPMLKACEDIPKMSGNTAILVDISGSMDWALSMKSDLKRVDAATALAILVRETCDTIDIYSFSTQLVKVAPRRGFALSDAILNSQSHGGTALGKSLSELKKDYDRVIVITDEQSSDRIPDATNDKSYIINVATNQNGVGYHSGWKHINGFSENVLRYIQALEDNNQ